MCTLWRTDTPFASKSPGSLDGGSMMTFSAHRLSVHARSGLLAIMALLGLAISSPAHAQLSRIGSTNLAAVSFTLRGTDVAYDPYNNVYLIVGAGGSVE